MKKTSEMSAAISPKRYEDFAFVENCWIPMPDGTRLAATLWLPAGAEKSPVPVILEVLPYRKRDHTAARDFENYSYFAQRGFAGCRVDMRGSGDSGGVFDTYQSYEDVVCIIAWLRDQKWCSGNVGMMGLSWGGINAVMAADRSAPGLKAVVACSFSYDRYRVGMTWKNGCLLNENFIWASSVNAFASRPPDPAVVGPEWRSIWLKRLESQTPELLNFLGHQHPDEYWDKHALRNAEGIDCPLLLIGGWADSNYVQTIPWLMDRVRGPRKAIFGAWGHRYPHWAIPGPSINLLGEAARWFGHYLRGDDNNIPQEPMVHAYISRNVPPAAFYATAPGEWIADEWPPSSEQQVYFLNGKALTIEPPAQMRLQHKSSLTTGLCSGEVMPWFAYAPGPELPDDQQRDDGLSLCFDTEPLAETVVTLGAPVLDLEFSVDQPIAFLAVRICDVRPNGESTRVNLGLFNLNQFQDDRHPEKLEPGRRYRFQLPLDFKGYAFEAEHRIRLAISTSYWPMVWPSPQPVQLTVYLAESRLLMPVRKAPAMTSSLDLKPEVGRSLRKTELVAPRRRRWVTQDLVSDETSLHIIEMNGAYRLDDLDWEASSYSEEEYTISVRDPLSASARTKITWSYKRGVLELRTETTSRMTSSKTAFQCELSVSAWEGDKKVSDRGWKFEIPREMI